MDADIVTESPHAQSAAGPGEEDAGDEEESAAADASSDPANQPDATADAVFRKTPRVPFYFRRLDGRMIKEFFEVIETDAAAGMIAPHVFVRPTPRSIADGDDVELSRAFAAIARR